MAISARLNRGETLGDRVMKVDHAGEHGAVCIYRAQRWVARWTASDMIAEIDAFLAHERRHRALFGQELARRGARRCRSYALCGLGGLVLGLLTGLAGRTAIAATTRAIETVVLRHMRAQIEALSSADARAAATLRTIIVDEQAHHDLSDRRLPRAWVLPRLIDPIVASSTELVIWVGMHL
jgi:ubiquinone biosynthesis monooxygenase Coq7